MIGALDPNGFRPLSLGQLSNGAYILASETCAFDVVGAKFIRTIDPGEMVIVNHEHFHIEKFTEETTMSVDSMELSTLRAQIQILRELMYIQHVKVWAEC